MSEQKTANKHDNLTHPAQSQGAQGLRDLPPPKPTDADAEQVKGGMPSLDYLLRLNRIAGESSDDRHK